MITVYVTIYDILICFKHLIDRDELVRRLSIRDTSNNNSRLHLFSSLFDNVQSRLLLLPTKSLVYS